jgi:hypothetical protein
VLSAFVTPPKSSPAVPLAAHSVVAALSVY